MIITENTTLTFVHVVQHNLLLGFSLLAIHHWPGFCVSTYFTSEPRVVRVLFVCSSSSYCRRMQSRHGRYGFRVSLAALNGENLLINGMRLNNGRRDELRLRLAVNEVINNG